MEKLNILHYLERTDKWYLGGGNRLIWTPQFPVWLGLPGLWDKAHYYNYEIEPVFTWTILDDAGNEIKVSPLGKKWDPSKLTVRFTVAPEPVLQVDKSAAKGEKYFPIIIEESKCCLPADVLASVVSIKNPSHKTTRLHFVAWTVQQNHISKKTTWLSDVGTGKNRIIYTKHLYRENAPTLPVSCIFGINEDTDSISLNLSEGLAARPFWDHTPFFESFRRGSLPEDRKFKSVSDDGLLYMALHKAITLRAGCKKRVGIFFSAAPTRNQASKNFRTAALCADPIKTSVKNWNDYFASVPHFECSDEHLTRYYWYRWYGLRLLTVDGREGNYMHPAVCEGIGYFRAPISYSAPCHMLENRWLRDSKLSQGSLLSFVANQRKDGGYPGYIDMNYNRGEKNGAEPFYHANWGNALRGLYRLHPDKRFLKKAYESLVEYVRYFDRERDKEKSGLYDIFNHYETGQEYMHRYIAVNPGADRNNWGNVFRLKGVDASVYIYALKKTLAFAAEELKLKKSGWTKWSSEADKIKNAILSEMWDTAEEMFFDVDPETGERTRVKSAVCFYPYMTDIVSDIHLRGLERHLFNDKEFWTAFPVPSSSADDEYFSAEPVWKSKRMNCPWNGRVWPMTNSHIAEAIARSAINFNRKDLKVKAAEFMTKFIKMMFFDGDPERPNCFEHYNPFTGQPSVYRGVDDYQHSCVNDLIIKYVAGVRICRNTLIIDPFPFNLNFFSLGNLTIGSDRITATFSGGKLTVSIGGKNFSTRGGNERIAVRLTRQGRNPSSL